MSQRSNVKQAWISSVLLAVAAAASTTVAQTSAPTAPTSRSAIAPTTQPRTADDAVTPKVKDPNRHAEFLYRKTQGPIGVLFVGDSITDFWPRRGEFSWLKFAPYQPADFGVSADRTEHVLWRLTNGELDGISPKVVVVMIGTNNVGQTSERPEWAAAGVARVVETIRTKLPQSKVLLLGVFPRDVKGSVRRDAAAAINPIIAKLDDGNMVRYLDIGHVFLDADGEIPPDVMPDKLHPTSKGYDLWYDAMRPLLDEMMK